MDDTSNFNVRVDLCVYHSSSESSSPFFPPLVAQALSVHSSSPQQSPIDGAIPKKNSKLLGINSS